MVVEQDVFELLLSEWLYGLRYTPGCQNEDVTRPYI